MSTLFGLGLLRRELLDRTTIWNRYQLHRLIVDYMQTSTGLTARSIKGHH